jgi:cytidine deaminase
MNLETFEEMIRQAATVRENAHVPYSNFRVGACLEAESGKLYAGCNVENVAYPQGQCAEASAIGTMVGAGDTKIVSVVVMGGGPSLCTPCGGCRQRLREFADAETPVHICGPEGLRKTVTLGELLPWSFDSYHPEPR